MIFNYRGGKINYHEYGQGHPVVLLHGYLETSGIWSDFAEKLSEKFRVIVIDLPGHGGSDCFGNIHTMDFMATVVRDLMENSGYERFFLAGHSLGGYVTLAFADLFPGSLTGFCLFHSQPFPDTPETKEKRATEINMVTAGNQDQFIQMNIERMYSPLNLEKLKTSVTLSLAIAKEIKGEGITAVLKGMMDRPSRLAVMEAGRIPCLWILGESDNYIPCAEIQSRVNLPENARIQVLKNSGHLGFIEEEGLSLTILSDFITALI